jgi:DNA replication protein DnaC
MTSITTDDPLMARARALKLYGLLAHWEDIEETGWIAALIQWEEEERARRSLERRLGNAHLGRFRPLADFDWDWPKRCDREAIEELMGLAFLQEAANAILVGPNGVGKSTIARNIAHQAVLAGHTVLCTSAAQMLGELAAAWRSTPARAYCSSTRSAICPTPTAMPICSLRSSRAATRRNPPW